MYNLTVREGGTFHRPRTVSGNLCYTEGKMKKTILSVLIVALLLSFAACSGGEKPEPEVTTVRDNAAAAADFDSAVASIGEATVENEKKIDDAFAAYWSMPQEARDLTKKYGELTALRSELVKKYVVKQYRDTRIPHERILIGGYGWRYASDEEALAFVDSHFNFMWNCDVDILNRFGLGCFAGAGHLGIPVSKDMSEEDFRAAVEGKNFDRDNLWCVDFIDEPSVYDIPKYWRTAKIVAEELLPQCGLFMNLLPFYAFADDLRDYERYLDTYFDTVGKSTDIVSFDHYVYAPENEHGKMEFGSPMVSMLKNFEMLSERCRENGHDLCAILQNVDVWKPDVNAEGYYSVSAEMMKFQAYVALAFGSKAIAWFETGYPAGTPVDPDGKRNEMFDKLEEVNGDVEMISPVYMRYSFDSNVVLCGKASRKLKSKIDFYDGSRDPADLKQSAVTDLTAGNTSVLITGHFKKNVGEGDAFMFVPLSESDFQKNTNTVSSVSFRTSSPDAVVTAYRKGIPVRIEPVDGVYTVEIRNADAAFVTVG